MSFKAGDKVRFLHDIGGGIISRIIDSKQVLVETDEGFKILYQVNQLVKDEKNGQKAIISNETSNPKKRNQEPADAIVKPLLAIVPGGKFNPQEITYHFNLLNDGNYHFSYTISLESASEMQFVDSGILEPETQIEFDSLGYFDLQHFKSILIQLNFFTRETFQLIEPITFRYPVRLHDLLNENNYKENDYFDRNAYIINIENSKEIKISISDPADLSQIVMMKEGKTKPDHETKHEPGNDIVEVDLHIHAIVDDYKDLSNGEIVSIQVARFETALEGAIRNKTRRIVFIHGVGNGKLKYEIRRMLDQKFSELKYQDASFSEYGFGATLVLLNDGKTI